MLRRKRQLVMQAQLHFFFLIDLHIHRQQEQVFDVVFVGKQQDWAAWQGKSRWGRGDRRAVSLPTRDTVTQCPGKRSRACPTTLTRSRRQTWSLKKSTVMREKVEAAKQGAEQQSASPTSLPCSFVRGLQGYVWIYRIRHVSHVLDNCCHC